MDKWMSITFRHFHFSSIKEFFEKDIDRNIETVIKADDRDNISTEVAEYVITKEIAKKIRDYVIEKNKNYFDTF